MNNINNNYKELKNITPFKLCVLTNFPFIEADFDAVTNYQLLCKVVEYLNEIIANSNLQNSNITQLEQNFITLYDYVKDYFDNLDVQNEINVKLDEMAADGTLDGLIKPYFDEYKKEIDNDVKNQNDKITVLENRMNSFSSLPSGSTTGDAELIDIRVPTVNFNSNKNYSTAGNAVRGQISVVDSEITANIGSNFLEWRQGIWYDNNKRQSDVDNRITSYELDLSNFSRAIAGRGYLISGGGYIGSDFYGLSTDGVKIRDWDWFGDIELAQILGHNFTSFVLFYKKIGESTLSPEDGKTTVYISNVKYKSKSDSAVLSSTYVNPNLYGIYTARNTFISKAKNRMSTHVININDFVYAKADSETLLGVIWNTGIAATPDYSFDGNIGRRLGDIVYLSEVSRDELIKAGAVDFTIVTRKRDNSDFTDEINTGVNIYLSDKNKWINKLWYAYGTSMTADSSYANPYYGASGNEGKYSKYLRNLSNMNLVNNGVSGGGIVVNTRIKERVMNMNDGKDSADLITLEVCQNDFNCIIGSIYDTGDDTFCGALNQCIRYLQTNTNAQIVVLSSTIDYKKANGELYTTDTRGGEDNHTFYDMEKAVREVCGLNSVYYIGMGDSSGLGSARMSDKYIVDNLHHTDLGGYILAEAIWSKLKDIPLWYTTTPY